MGLCGWDLVGLIVERRWVGRWAWVGGCVEGWNGWSGKLVGCVSLCFFSASSYRKSWNADRHGAQHTIDQLEHLS